MVNDHSLPEIREWLKETAHPAVRLRLANYGSISEGGKEFQITLFDRKIAVCSNSISLNKLLLSLKTGVSWCEVMNLLPEEQEMQFLRLIDCLMNYGALYFDLLSEDRCVLTFMPQSPKWRPSCGDQNKKIGLRLSRLVRLENCKGQWRLLCPLAAVVIQLHDAEFRKWLVDEPEAFNAKSHEQPSILISWLMGNGVFHTESDETSSLAMWDVEDMMFHVHSRAGRLFVERGQRSAPIPGTSPGQARRSAWEGAKLSLPTVKSPLITLPDALVRRRSHPQSGSRTTITLSQLAGILKMSMMVCSTGVGAFEMEVSKRPYPSAGGCHPLEVYLAVYSCVDLVSGFWHYDSYCNQLTWVSPLSSPVKAIITSAMTSMQENSPSDITVVISARFNRSFFKYQGIGYANILREVGALYQSLHLSAVAFGCSACPIGVGNVEYFSQATGLDPFEEGSVGEFCINGYSSLDQ